MKSNSFKTLFVFLSLFFILFFGATSSKAQWVPDKQLLCNLNIVEPGNIEALADGIRIRFNTGYSPTTIDDILKMSNFGENISSYRENKNLIVEKRPLIITKDTIFLRIYNMGIKHYRFKMFTENYFESGLICFLEDSYTKTSHFISMSGSNTDYDFQVTAAPESANPYRFRFVFASLVSLPVTITDFKAAMQGKNIAVEWKASNQFNMKEYQIEKSTDGINFTKAATQAARGNNGSDATYNWLDMNPAAGNNFYRIRSVGIGGEAKISNVINLKTGKDNPAISTYPNPVTNGTVALQFNDTEKGLYQLRLVNNNGQVLFTKPVNHNGGSATQSLMLGNGIPKGNYYLEIIKPDNSKTTKSILIND